MYVSIKIKGLDELYKRLDPKLVTRAARPAFRRASNQARTAGIKAVTKKYNIKTRVMKEKTYTRVRGLNAVIRVISHRLSLLRFGARQTRRGITLKVLKAGGRKLIPSAFIGRNMKTPPDRLPTGFIRERVSSGAKKRVWRHPLEILHGPSAPYMMGQQIDIIRKTFDVVFLKRLKHEIDRLWRK